MHQCPPPHEPPIKRYSALLTSIQFYLALHISTTDCLIIKAEGLLISARRGRSRTERVRNSYVIILGQAVTP